MSAKKWNFYYDKQPNKFAGSRIVDIASLWCAIGLLWLSFLRIIEEQFPSFLSYPQEVYDVHSYDFPVSRTQTIGLDWLVILLFLVCLWLPTSGCLPQKKGLRIGVTIVGIAIPIFYIIINATKFTEGILSLAYQYLQRFNAYQGTNIRIPSGEAVCVPVAFTAVLMLLWLIIWGLSVLFKRRVVLVLFPLIAVLVEFMVGTSPTGNGIAILFVAAFMLMIPKGTKAWKHVTVLVVTVISILLSNWLFEEEIERLSSNRALADNWVEILELPEVRLDNLFHFDFQVNSETLDNHQPNYSGTTVFTIASDKMPTGYLYLRGYCGTDYSGGSWKWNKSTFQNACKQAGYSETEAAKIISKMPYMGYEEALYDAEEYHYTISNVGSTGNTAYVPYVFDYESLDEEYTYVGDFLLRKDVFDRTLEVTSLDSDTHVNTLVMYTHYAKENENYETMLWYNKVAEAYAQSNTTMECIQDAASVIKERVDYPTEMTLLLTSLYYAYDDETIDAVLENLYRMGIASEVRDYLADQMLYSQILDELPFGADPIEYALTVSHEGYCMHYASAAALILKEIGIPARYASGYIVRSSDFGYDREAGTYIAQISDYNSHAWVEIYLENIGWVPIEVTAGYDGTGSLPTQMAPSYWENISEANRNQNESESESEETESSESSEEVIPSETESESESESESTSESESESENADTQTPNVSESEDTSQTPSGNGQGAGFEFKLPGYWTYMVGVLALGLVGVAVVYAVRARASLLEHKLEGEIQRKHARRAVALMNRHIYRRLRWKKRGYMNDDAYLQALIEHYDTVAPEDWKRYMDIVKKVHYSKDEISEEEMMHCYQCYKGV